MLTLDLRPCVLGGKYSGDVKESETEQTRTFNFELEEVLLTKREFNALLGEPLAWDALFNSGAKPVEPMLKSIKELELKHAVEGASVSVTYGPDASEQTFAGCKLSKIKLSLLTGGDVALACKVTCEPGLDADLAEFIAQMGNTAECEICAQLPQDQQDLPLNRVGDSDDDRPVVQ
jgi:hypothetical protein